MSTPENTSAVAEPGPGELLLQRLAAQELDRVPLLFEPAADLRALLPGGLLVGEGTEDIGGMFATWFGDVDEFEVIDTDLGQVGSRLMLRWRVRLRGDRFGPRPVVVEQHAYADAGPTNLIRTMSLVCSGYCREPDRA